MNYFELINKCLIELNYKSVSAFTDLIKNDHLKIKNIMNIINSEVCGFDNWNFLLRKTSLDVSANSFEVENPIEGRIFSIVLGNEKLRYTHDFEAFYDNENIQGKYSVFNKKLLFQPYDEDKTLDIIYYTNNCVENSSGVEKKFFEDETDKSFIPEPYVEPLLVYGTCMRMKANPDYAKFNYWYSMYKNTLSTMRSTIGTSMDDYPTISLNRGF